jgi:tryptophan-rich sensory protein
MSLLPLVLLRIRVLNLIFYGLILILRLLHIRIQFQLKCSLLGFLEIVNVQAEMGQMLIIVIINKKN